jgi:hypothetical protein
MNSYSVLVRILILQWHLGPFTLSQENSEIM